MNTKTRINPLIIVLAIFLFKISVYDNLKRIHFGPAARDEFTSRSPIPHN